MHDPQEPHFSALKRILRYIRGTLHHGLQMYVSPSCGLIGQDAPPLGDLLRGIYYVFLGHNLLS